MTAMTMLDSMLDGPDARARGTFARAEAPKGRFVGLRRCTLAALVWAAIVSPAIGPTALASEALTTNDSAAASNSGNTTELEDIVVTATKREENLQNVPVSILALSQSDLQLAGAKTVDDFAALTPGIQFDNQSGYGAGMLTFISIRGINSDIGASTTGVYIDDTAIQDRLNQFTNFGNPYPVYFDLNRIEVERGPQGTLFGAGAEGGTIRFIFNQPDLQHFSGIVSSEVAQMQDGGLNYEMGVATGGPIITDVLGFRISAWDRKDGGYINSVDPFTGAITDPNTNRSESKAFRLALLGEFGPITVTPSVYYQSKQLHDATGFYGYLSDPDDGEFNAGHILPLPAADSYYLAAVNVQADLGFSKLTSISSYFSRFATLVDDETGFVGTLGVTSGGATGYGNPLGPEYPSSYSDAVAEPNQTLQRILTQEVRLSSADSSARIVWVGGLFYSRATQNETTNVYSTNVADTIGVTPPTASLLYEGTVAIDTQVAAFGQIYFGSRRSSS